VPKKAQIAGGGCPTLIGILITIVLALAGRFSLRMFDERTRAALAEASTPLRADYTKALAEELQKLKTSHQAELTQLEYNLQKRTEFMALHAHGLAFAAHNQHDDAIDSFREAFEIYTDHKDLLPEALPVEVLENIIVCLRKKDPNNFLENVEKEFSNPVYDNAKETLTSLALSRAQLAPIIRRRISANGAPPRDKTETAAEPAIPATSPALSQTNPSEGNKK